MRIFYDNKATLGQITSIVASSTASGYPSANAVHPFRGMQWKTGTSTAAESIEFQFPAAVTAQACCIVNHDLTVSDALTLQANSSSSWGAPPVSQAFTITSADMNVVLGSPQTYRYWRLALTKASAGLTRSIGVVMLCSIYDTPYQPDYDGFKETLNDPSRITKAISGQTYSEVLPKSYEHQIDFSAADQTFKDSMLAIFTVIGETGQMAYQVETSGVLTKLWYARMKKPASFKVVGFDSSLVYDMSLETEEML